VFGATKAKLRNIDFQRINADENQAEKDKYGVHSYPHVIFLDGSGKVLAGATPSLDQAKFEQQINEAGQSK